MKIIIEYGLAKRNLSTERQKNKIDDLGKALKNNLMKNGISVIDITSLISTQDLDIEEQKVVLLSNSYSADFLISLSFENGKGVINGAYAYSNNPLGNTVANEILANLSVGYKNNKIYDPMDKTLISKFNNSSIIINPFCSDSVTDLEKFNGKFGYEFIAESIANGIKKIFR